VAIGFVHDMSADRTGAGGRDPAAQSLWHRSP